MRIRVQKWGNSLAFRIPKAYAQETNFRKGSAVEISVADGKLVLTPAEKPKHILKDLLKKVTKENIHEEHNFGEKAGQEIW